MTAPSLLVLAVTFAPLFAAGVQQRPAAPVSPPKPIILTGCVVPSIDPEDMLQLVPAEPVPSRPVGTTGPSPAWTVPAYLLLGGNLSTGVHANKTVEITGVLDTAAEAAPATTPAVARLQVQSAKVIAQTCTPKKQKK